MQKKNRKEECGNGLRERSCRTAASLLKLLGFGKNKNLHRRLAPVSPTNTQKSLCETLSYNVIQNARLCLLSLSIVGKRLKQQLLAKLIVSFLHQNLICSIFIYGNYCNISVLWTLFFLVRLSYRNIILHYTNKRKKEEVEITGCLHNVSSFCT